MGFCFRLSAGRPCGSEGTRTPKAHTASGSPATGQISGLTCAEVFDTSRRLTCLRVLTWAHSGPDDHPVALPLQPPSHGAHDKIPGVDPVDAQLNLRYLLNEWDPIGVADLATDEYDCLIAPLLTRLDNGADPAEISEFLRYELEDHFDLDPTHYDVDSVANRLVAGWTVMQQR